jgi:hypothetical protein
MKILVLINEDFFETRLGINTSLAYCLACVDLGHQVFVYQIPENGDLKKQIEVIFLDKNNAQNLVDEFKLQNAKISEKKLVKDVFKSQKTQINFNEIDFVIQRLEPMKAPFPPVGSVNINQFLGDFSSRIFTKNKKYNLPINCYGDKELPLILGNEIEVPTEISFFDDEDLIKKITQNLQKYQKIVMKPDDSAQGYGVFALGLDKNGFDVKYFKENILEDFLSIQNYKIKEVNREIIEILLFLQQKKIKNEHFSQKIGDFDKKYLQKEAKKLYGDKILIQPFFEGVKTGDIRINLLKIDDEFKVFGAIFRKSITNNQDEFKTSFITGSSSAKRIEEVLSQDEQDDLASKIAIILQKLNESELRKKYQNCNELGLDFLLKGDEKQVFLGEANHYCQGLIPVSEALENEAKTESFYQKIGGISFDYDGGLGVLKNVVANHLKSLYN